MNASTLSPVGPPSASQQEADIVNSVGRVPVTVQIMLGTVTLKLSELMALKPDAELLLDQGLGQLVTIVVNGTKIAKGELYVLETEGDKLGVRVTEMLTREAGK